MSQDIVVEPVGLESLVDSLSARFTVFARGDGGGCLVINGPRARGASAAWRSAAASVKSLPPAIVLDAAAMPRSPRALVESLAELAAAARQVERGAALAEAIGEILDDGNALPFFWYALASQALLDKFLAARFEAQREQGTAPLDRVLEWVAELPASWTAGGRAVVVLENVERLSVGELLHLLELLAPPKPEMAKQLLVLITVDPEWLGPDAKALLAHRLGDAALGIPTFELPPLDATALTAWRGEMEPDTAARLLALGGGDAAGVLAVWHEADQAGWLHQGSGGAWSLAPGAFDMALATTYKAAKVKLSPSLATRILTLAALQGDTFTDEAVAQSLWMLGNHLGDDRQEHLDTVINLFDDLEPHFEDLGFVGGGQLHAHRFQRAWFRRALLADITPGDHEGYYRAAAIAMDQIHGAHPNQWSWRAIRLYRMMGTPTGEAFAAGLRDRLVSLASPLSRGWELHALRRWQRRALEPVDFADWSIRLIRFKGQLYPREAVAVLVEQGIECAVAARDVNHQCDLLLAKATLREQEGKHAESFDLARTASEMAVAGGVDPLRQANVMNFIAMLYWQRRDLESTRGHLERAIALASSVAPDHRDLAGLYFNLGAVLRLAKNDEGAETNFRRALAIKERTLGDHPETAAVLVALAGFCAQTERLEEAEVLFRRAAMILERHRGDHPETAAALDSLGVILGQRGQVEEAERCMLEALTMFSRIHGQHPTTATVLQNLGSLHYNRQDFARAEPYAQQALAVITNCAPRSPKAVECLRNLAAVLHGKGDEKNAKIWMQRAMELHQFLARQNAPKTLAADPDGVRRLAENQKAAGGGADSGPASSTTGTRQSE